MRKKEIFEKLDSLELDKKQYLIIGGAALVCQGIKKETGSKNCKIQFYENLHFVYTYSRSYFLLL